MYIGNQMIARPPSAVAPTSASDDYYAGYDNYDISDTTDAPMVETHITFNGGGRWQRMPAPKTYNNPNCNRCVRGPGPSPALCYSYPHRSTWSNTYQVGRLGAWRRMLAPKT